MKPLNIAIVGATGLVGQTFIKILEEENIKIGTLKLFASEKSKGKTLLFHDKVYLVETVKAGCFKGIDYVLMSAGSNVSKEVARMAVLEGAIVIDNSSAFREDESIPLVVPEINLNEAFKQPLIANPNCSTIQSVVPLKALDIAFGITSVDYVTLQAVSGSGQKGLDDLEKETPSFYPHNIKETAIPLIGNILENHYSEEEMKMVNETKKILALPHLNVHATCIRVPVKTGHGVVMTALLNTSPSLQEIKVALENFKGIKVLDRPKIHEYPTSVVASGTNDIYVGRIKIDLNDPKKISMYIVSDNIRKGAALNAIQIMKGLINEANTY